jgi:hypothetical protein
MKVYLVDDDLKKICFLQPILQLLSSSPAAAGISFMNGFERWFSGVKPSPEWFVNSTPGDRVEALESVKKCTFDPKLLIDSMTGDDGICLIDMELPEDKGYTDVADKILQILKSTKDTKTIGDFKTIMKAIGMKSDYRLASVLLALCKNYHTPCLTISMRMEPMYLMELRNLGFESVTFPYDPYQDNTELIRSVAATILAKIDILSHIQRMTCNWFATDAGIASNELPHNFESIKVVWVVKTVK